MNRTTATGGSLWRQDTLGSALPVARRGRKTALPDACGAAGSGGPKGPYNGDYKHGRYTAEAIASRRCLRAVHTRHQKISPRARKPLGKIHGLMVTNAARFGTEKAQEPLRRVNAAGTHLLSLINEILDL